MASTVTMPSVQKSVLLPYSARQMFDLVQDVHRYPEFLPWCAGAEVRDETDSSVLATLRIAYKGIKQSFTTHNTWETPTRIQMELRDGPFSRLDGCWQFRELRADACKVEFVLDYSFGGNLLGRALAPVFDHIARSFVDAFVARAISLYGEDGVARS